MAKTKMGRHDHPMTDADLLEVAGHKRQQFRLYTRPLGSKGIQAKHSSGWYYAAEVEQLRGTLKVAGVELLVYPIHAHVGHKRRKPLPPIIATRTEQTSDGPRTITTYATDRDRSRRR